MTQPVWQTPSGSLGVIPEGVFYRTEIVATAGDQDVFFRVLAGQLPSGIQVTANGVIEGVPKNFVKVQGVPQEVNRDVTSRFAIRAFTRRVINGVIIIDRLADRTFTLTVTGRDVPEFITPAGNVGTYYDGTFASTTIEFRDQDPSDVVRARVLSGQLPPGLVLNPLTGEISGVIIPLVGPPGTAEPGYDVTPKDEYPNDFTRRSASKNYQFTIEISDGENTNIRTFEIFVYSKDSMTADTTDFTADNTFITADVIPSRTPVLLTATGSLGQIRADNYYAFRFEAVDWDGDAIEYIISTGIGKTPPPGLTLETETGWLYGYIPDQGATEATYSFSIIVRKRDKPDIASDPYDFTATIIGNVDTEVTWLTPADLGSIDNGSTSLFYVRAVTSSNRSLQYRIVQGSDSKLPQGLALFSSGNIVGRVSFNTFALDDGTTTFDVTRDTRLLEESTTFDLTYAFDVNAYSPATEQQGFRVNSIVVNSGGSGYTSQPTVTISPPPSTEGAVQATAGVITIVGGIITEIELSNPGSGYISPPSVTITGGGGTGAVASTTVTAINIVNLVSVTRRFTIHVNRVYNEPYENLYVLCMPPENDRDFINSVLQDQFVLPRNLIYRDDDPNFGVAKNVNYAHAFGLTAATIEDYVASLNLNHYWKNLVLGSLETAQARDSDGNVIYEVVYSRIIDDLVNAQGQSVSKSVTLPYPVDSDTGNETTTVYPNSLINMRDQVVDEIGQEAFILPLWMISRQADNRVLGFTPAWVIAYVLPGQSGLVRYRLQQRYGDLFNTVDYRVDRYELDRSLSYLWNAVTKQWIPSPPQATTFDTFAIPFGYPDWQNTIGQTVNWIDDLGDAVLWSNSAGGDSEPGTIFDGGSTRFIAPALRPNQDEFDKYLLFPKVNILG